MFSEDYHVKSLLDKDDNYRHNFFLSTHYLSISYLWLFMAYGLHSCKNTCTASRPQCLKVNRQPYKGIDCLKFLCLVEFLCLGPPS